MRPRPAPSERRSANSRPRAVLRARSRLARFAHAMSSTAATVTISTTSGCEKLSRKFDWPRAPGTSSMCSRSRKLRCAASRVISARSSTLRLPVGRHSRGGLREIDGRGHARDHRQPLHAVLRDPRLAAVGVVDARVASRSQLLLHRHRGPEIDARADDDAREALRRDADDRERQAVHANRRSHGSRIGAVLARPEVVAQHRDRRCSRRRRVIRGEHAAGRRAHAEHVEPIARHELPNGQLGRALTIDLDATGGGARGELHAPARLAADA